MTRSEEYTALREELEREPEMLESTVNQALERGAAFQRRARAWGASAASLAACFAAFILLVNLSVPFARACGTVPLLRELAQAVAWSPSLSAAVANEYVQPVGMEQTSNGITARIEYVIVDRRQVSIFYTLDDALGRPLDADVSAFRAGRDRLERFSVSSGSYGTPNGELRQADAAFVDRDVPPELEVALRIYENQWRQQDLEPAEVSAEASMLSDAEPLQPDSLADFTFTLSFDPYFTEQGTIVTVGQTFRLDGQTLTLDSAEIYPTHLRLDFSYAPENTAWLTGLDFYLENERGDRFLPVRSGISAAGEDASPSMVTYWMDTTYFSSSEALTLYITRSRWLEKDRQSIRLDLETQTHDLLPEQAELVHIQREADGCLLTFRTRMYEKNHFYELWSGYTDASGEERSLDASASAVIWTDPATGEYQDGSAEGCFFTTIALRGVQGTEVLLHPVFTRVADHTQPVRVPVTG